MRVRTIMSHPVVSIDSSAPLRRAMEAMAEHGIRHVPVVEAGWVVAILTERDVAAIEPTLARCGLGDGFVEMFLRQAVGKFVRSHGLECSVCGVRPDDDVADAMRLMRTHLVTAVPVLQNGDVVGIVSYVDIIEAFEARADTARLRAPAGRVARLTDRDAG